VIRRSSLALSILTALSLSAFAQEVKRSSAESEKPESDRVKTPGKGVSESPTFDDLKNSLGDLEQKESKEEKDKREAIVQKNFDETLKIYGEALGKRNGEMQSVNRRLDVNKGLEGKFDRMLKSSRTALATMRAQFINRTVALKKSLEEGKISRDAYEKLLEEDTKRFRNRERELLDDIAFYQDEVQSAQRSTKDLSTKKELMSFDPFGGAEKNAEREKPQPGMEQKLKSTLLEVSGFGSRSVMESLK